MEFGFPCEKVERNLLNFEFWLLLNPCALVDMLICVIELMLLFIYTNEVVVP
jgi:hypothetical protein